MTKRDLIIIGAVLLLAAAGFALTRLGGAGGADGAEIVIYVHGEEYARVKAHDHRAVRIEQADGSVNVVRIAEAGVCMEYSTCKNQLCVNQGVVDPANTGGLELGNWIVCLPNGVSVELLAGGQG